MVSTCQENSTTRVTHFGKSQHLARKYLAAVSKSAKHPFPLFSAGKMGCLDIFGLPLMLMMLSLVYFEPPDAAFFCKAQRRLTASAMRRRPSADKRLFFLAGFAAATAAFRGLPLRF